MRVKKKKCKNDVIKNEIRRNDPTILELILSYPDKSVEELKELWIEAHLEMEGK